MFKELIRRVIFYLPFPDEFVAQEGTLKYKFLSWLYGDGEPEFNVWTPEDDTSR